MAEGKDNTGLDLGVYGRIPSGRRFGAVESVAALLTLLWLLAAAVFLLGGDSSGVGALTWAIVAVTVVVPVALIWVAALAVAAARTWREDAARLQGAIDALRHAYVAQSQAASLGGKPSVERKLDAIAAAQKNTETVLATFVSRRDGGGQHRPALSTRPAILLTPAPSDPQPSLALGTPVEPMREPLTSEEFIRAMNFPDDANDKEGFRALRRALEDPRAAKLVRASQDVLTLLSQDGIYMDDLRPDRARPELWRRFAAGERGRAVAALGGIRDRSSLALSAARMRQDVIFRDAAHHFLRHFDKTFAEFADYATDQELSDLAETRTARAFMLLGRVTGTFD